MALAHSPKIVSDRLLFAVDAANTKSYPGSGTTFFDLSKSANNSALFVNVDASNFNGEHVDVNGTDQHIRFPNISTATNSFTIECWANWDDVGTNSGAARVPFGFGAFFRFYLDNSNYLSFWVREAGAGGSSAVTDNISVTQAGNWYQLVGTCQGGGSRKLYRNGELRNSDTISFNVDTGNGENNLYIGNAFNGSNSYFDGKIAIARFYDKVLTDAEVLQNYNALKGRFGL